MPNIELTETFGHDKVTFIAHFEFVQGEVDMQDVEFENGASILECELLEPFVDQIFERAHQIITERGEQYRSGQLRHGA